MPMHRVVIPEGTLGAYCLLLLLEFTGSEIFTLAL